MSLENPIPFTPSSIEDADAIEINPEFVGETPEGRAQRLSGEKDRAKELNAQEQRVIENQERARKNAEEAEQNRKNAEEQLAKLRPEINK